MLSHQLKFLTLARNVFTIAAWNMSEDLQIHSICQYSRGGLEGRGQLEGQYFDSGPPKPNPIQKKGILPKSHMFSLKKLATYANTRENELKMSKILNYLTPLLLWYRNPPDRFYHACVESTKFEQYLDFLHLCLTWSQVFLGHCFSWKECVYWKINITREPKSGGSCYCLRRMSKTKTSEIY